MRAERHYLDCNATAPLRPEARRAMLDAAERGGNPSSVHAEGRAARAILDTARRQVAALAGLPPSSVHFTSGGTEANNWALSQTDRQVLAAVVSHDSVLAVAGVGTLETESNGLVDPETLKTRLKTSNVGMLSVMAANNETGVIQPLEDIAEICRAHGVLLHVDAVQAPGKLDLAPIAAQADVLSLSAHKLGGPAGCGALLVRPGLDPVPLIRGGGQEARRRAGTENLIGIAGFGAAAGAVAVQGSAEVARILALRDALEAQLRAFCPETQVFGADVQRAANTTCIRMPGVPAETQVMALDLAGVAVSAGSACSSGKVTPSHVLIAMGCGEEVAGEAIRISLGWATTDADVTACAAAWQALWDRKKAA